MKTSKLVWSIALAVSLCGFASMANAVILDQGVKPADDSPATILNLFTTEFPDVHGAHTCIDRIVGPFVSNSAIENLHTFDIEDLGFTFIRGAPIGISRVLSPILIGSGLTFVLAIAQAGSAEWKSPSPSFDLSADSKACAGSSMRQADNNLIPKTLSRCAIRIQ